MKLISFALTCVAIALFASACTETPTTTSTNTSRAAASPAAPAPTATPDPLATARANYAKHCEACHGPNAEGGPVKVENKQIKVPSLKRDHAVKLSDDHIAKMITNGEEEMPPFKDKMSQQEIADLVKFVRKEFQGK
ncbi:MAG TPA: cytochrome c [Pyrinomonadaceae bacterium]|nr:cytochrome c [Pyrinomonadaceae bacterium]